ncbi:hypothetical protein BUALT_Bualt03G0146200 [Buddleja alternifolia]|uniref:Retrotransposon gag domain-containing protein n=1 Tax=Buddleja alternifolia TaxID=168488 RepID=A0AAV6XW24_9LAMI|nr:hypothetical protein BUALT_Bualt03G0146200 [Buddleja alternifolia]
MKTRSGHSPEARDLEFVPRGIMSRLAPSQSLRNFRISDLPKYDGSTDPKQHIVAYENLMTMHNFLDALNSRIFVMTFTGRAQEWFTHLAMGCIVDCIQFMRKFEYHFANKQKYTKYVAHLFSIRQKEDENLRSFVDHFNDETLDVQGLTNEIKINLMINALKMGPFADALIRDHPSNMHELMVIAQKYIYTEEMQELKKEERRVQKQLKDKALEKNQSRRDRSRSRDRSRDNYRRRDDYHNRDRRDDKRRDECRDRYPKEENNPHNNLPLHREIITIAGGPTNGDSQNA